MVFSPVERDARTIELRGRGAIARDEKYGFAVRAGQHRMDAVVAAALHGPQLFDRVELVVVLTGGDAVEATVLGVFVVVHANPEGVKGPEQAIGGLDRGGDVLDRRGIERLAR